MSSCVEASNRNAEEAVESLYSNITLDFQQRGTSVRPSLCNVVHLKVIFSLAIAAIQRKILERIRFSLGNYSPVNTLIDRFLCLAFYSPVQKATKCLITVLISRNLLLRKWGRTRGKPFQGVSDVIAAAVPPLSARLHLSLGSIFSLIPLFAYIFSLSFSPPLPSSLPSK